MKALTPHRKQAAHSLVELLVVVGIIGILISLIAPAASRVYSKAKAMKWENEGYPWKLSQELRAFYGQLKSFPAIPPEELHQNGVIQTRSLQFIRSPYVNYQPFSSKDPAEMIVIRFSWNNEWETKVTKAQLTEPLDP